MNKIKNFLSKTWFPTLVTINTIQFVDYFIALFTTSATPLIAFAAVVTGAVTMFGWSSIMFDITMTKFERERNSNVLDLNKKVK